MSDKNVDAKISNKRNAQCARRLASRQARTHVRSFIRTHTRYVRVVGSPSRKFDIYGRKLPHIGLERSGRERAPNERAEPRRKGQKCRAACLFVGFFVCLFAHLLVCLLRLFVRPSVSVRMFVKELRITFATFVSTTSGALSARLAFEVCRELNGGILFGGSLLVLRLSACLLACLSACPPGGFPACVFPAPRPACFPAPLLACFPTVLFLCRELSKEREERMSRL